MADSCANEQTEVRVHLGRQMRKMALKIGHTQAVPSKIQRSEQTHPQTASPEALAHDRCWYEGPVRAQHNERQRRSKQGPNGYEGSEQLIIHQAVTKA